MYIKKVLSAAFQYLHAAINARRMVFAMNVDIGFLWMETLLVFRV